MGAGCLLFLTGPCERRERCALSFPPLLSIYIMSRTAYINAFAVIVFKGYTMKRIIGV